MQQLPRDASLLASVAARSGGTADPPPQQAQRRDARLYGADRPIERRRDMCDLIPGQIHPAKQVVLFTGPGMTSIHCRLPHRRCGPGFGDICLASGKRTKSGLRHLARTPCPLPRANGPSQARKPTRPLRRASCARPCLARALCHGRIPTTFAERLRTGDGLPMNVNARASGRRHGADPSGVSATETERQSRPDAPRIRRVDGNSGDMILHVASIATPHFAKARDTCRTMWWGRCSETGRMIRLSIDRGT